MRRDAPEALSTGYVYRGTTLHVNTNGTVANNIIFSATDPFSLGETHTIYRGAVAATLTGFVHVRRRRRTARAFRDGKRPEQPDLQRLNDGARRQISTLTDLGGQRKSRAANSKVTLHNATLTTTTGHVDAGRGTLELTGTTSLNVG